jgi:hypothetical protein
MNRDDVKAFLVIAVLMIVIFATGVLLNLWVVFWGLELAGV